MNDTELDEMLDSWTARPATASLRERAQAGFTAAMEPRPLPATRVNWKNAFARRALKGLLAVAVVALGAFVLVVTQAVPQTLRLVSPPVQVPYVVDSEFIQYASDGSSEVAMHTASYSQVRTEFLLSRTLLAIRSGRRSREVWTPDSSTSSHARVSRPTWRKGLEPPEPTPTTSLYTLAAID
jgi:hypothetical protein